MLNSIVCFNLSKLSGFADCMVLEASCVPFGMLQFDGTVGGAWSVLFVGMCGGEMSLCMPCKPVVSVCLNPPSELEVYLPAEA